jgi:hypothetical protein
MRASRAYIAGFGTTSVLVASALLLLAVVSALVAFRGWPGTGLTENASSVVVGQPQRLAVEGRPQVALNASPAAAAVAGSPARGTAAAASGGARIAGTQVIRTAADTGPVATIRDPDCCARFRGDNEPTQRALQPPVDPADQAPGGLLPETLLTPQVNRVTQGLGDTTQGLTDNLGGTVGRLDPRLGQTVTDTGRMVAELVRGLGRPRL